MNSNRVSKTLLNICPWVRAREIKKHGISISFFSDPHEETYQIHYVQFYNEM